MSKKFNFCLVISKDRHILSIRKINHQNLCDLPDIVIPYCQNTVRETLELKSFYKNEEDIVLIGIACNEKKYKWNAAVRTYGLEWLFADQFSEEEIVVTLSRQLSWSHILTLLPFKNHEAKFYYAIYSSNTGNRSQTSAKENRYWM